jgi:hypothetical protein
MIRKSGNRFSEKIMLHQKDRAPNRFNLKPSRSRPPAFICVQCTSHESRILPILALPGSNDAKMNLFRRNQALSADGKVVSIILQICRTYGIYIASTPVLTPGARARRVGLCHRAQRRDRPILRRNQARSSLAKKASRSRGVGPRNKAGAGSDPPFLSDQVTALQCWPHLWASRRKTKALEAKRRPAPPP